MTTITVKVPERARVEIKVYSIMGQLVGTVYSGMLEEGSHAFEYTLPSSAQEGVYVYTLESHGVKLIRKMNVMR
jgi:hypothetical protein